MPFVMKISKDSGDTDGGRIIPAILLVCLLGAIFMLAVHITGKPSYGKTEFSEVYFKETELPSEIEVNTSYLLTFTVASHESSPQEYTYVVLDGGIDVEKGSFALNPGELRDFTISLRPEEAIVKLSRSVKWHRRIDKGSIESYIGGGRLQFSNQTSKKRIENTSEVTLESNEGSNIDFSDKPLEFEIPGISGSVFVDIPLDTEKTYIFTDNYSYSTGSEIIHVENTTKMDVKGDYVEIFHVSKEYSGYNKKELKILVTSEAGKQYDIYFTYTPVLKSTRTSALEMQIPEKE